MSKPFPWQELAIVAGVGVGLAFVGRRVPILKNPLVLGAALYTAGYAVAQQRPEGGWKMPDGQKYLPVEEPPK